MSSDAQPLRVSPGYVTEARWNAAEIRPLLALGLLVAGIGIVRTAFVFLLTIQVYGTGVGVLLGILALVPFVNMVVLLIVNGKAASILGKNGIKFGLLGPNLSQI